MKNKVQTVLGLVDPDDIGFTLTHEHLLHDLSREVFKQPVPDPAKHIEDAKIALENLKWIREYPYSFDDNLVFNDEAARNAVREEMNYLKMCCGNATVVENGSVGIRAEDHAEFLKSLSQTTGINIVAGAGYYVHIAHSESTRALTQEAMEEKIREDILTGMNGTGVKCGVIGEVGCSWPLFPFEKRSLAASAVIEQETNCPVIIHPGRNGNAPEEILRIFQEAGGRSSRVVMAHLDRTLFSLEELAEFAALGSFCEFDLFGMEVSNYQLDEEVDMPSDAQRIAKLRFLIQQGFGERIVAAHDIHTKHRLEKFGGHGYSHLYLTVLPKMLKRGFTEEDINKIFYTNPKKWLTFQ